MIHPGQYSITANLERLCDRHRVEVQGELPTFGASPTFALI